MWAITLSERILERSIGAFGSGAEQSTLPGGPHHGRTPNGPVGSDARCAASLIQLSNEPVEPRHRGQHQEPDQAQPSALAAAESGADNAAAAGSLAMKRIDKSANKGVIHKNAASRRMSRLAKRLNAAAAAAE